MYGVCVGLEVAIPCAVELTLLLLGFAPPRDCLNHSHIRTILLFAGNDTGLHADGSFAITTSGDAIAVLLPDSDSRVTRGPVFATSGVTVTVGGVAATVLGRDAASNGLVVQLPPYSDVCADGCDGVAGYKAIVVRNPVAQLVVSDGDNGWTAVFGAY